MADGAGAGRSQDQSLLPCRAFAARIPHPSAQLCPGPGRTGGSGRRAHFRGHARALDRHRRRAQADRHAIRARARRPYRARLQHPSRLARAAHRRHAPADVAAVYPQLADVEVEHAWSGVLGNALHRMPQIGELSGGLWLASGFGGHGINTTAMAGNILAQAIVEGDDAWRLFAPFELVWAGGSIGRAVMQVLYWWLDTRERLAARAARRREQEDVRLAKRAALREGYEETGVEAQLGAVLPREHLPAAPQG